MPSIFRAPTCVLSLFLLVGALAAAAPAETQSLETLLAYLKSPNIGTRSDAARKLGERRVRNQLAVESLSIAVRKDEAAEVRAEAVQALGKIKDFAAVPDMISALKDTDPSVRPRAVWSLVALYTEHDIDFITNRREGWNLFNPFLDTRDHEVIEPYQAVDPSIIRGLGESARGDRERDVRIASIRALGVLRGWGAIPQLAEALSADQDVRIEVIRTFIKIGDPTAGQYLIPFFHDSNQKVRTQAMVAAGLLKFRPAVAPLLSVYGLGPEKKGPVSKVTRAVKGVFTHNPPRDEAALWALSLIGDDRAEQTFVENIDDKNAMRRQYAFDGLARIAEKRYLDQISRLVLTEGDADVKLAQHWALYRMGSRPNIQYLIHDLDTDREEQARQYLMEIEDPSDLYPYIQSNSKVVRRRIIEILGRIGDQSTIKELEPVARSSGAETSDFATLAIKRIEWRMNGRPRAGGEVLRRDTAPPRAPNP
ncbi:MAG TPA: HEAT repeat domain-containing protein [Blastocatellia bacterium]|nr:HEAT repeat domain-containing protein [Blastocatellia bacterium]